MDRNGQIPDPEIPRSELKKAYPLVDRNGQILDPEIPRSELKKAYLLVDRNGQILDPEIPRSELKKAYPLVDRSGQIRDPEIPRSELKKALSRGLQKRPIPKSPGPSSKSPVLWWTIPPDEAWALERYVAKVQQIVHVYKSCSPKPTGARSRTSCRLRNPNLSAS